MQIELQQNEQRLALLQHESGQLSDLATDSKNKIAAFDEELDICFAAKKDDLARDLIKRKLETTRQFESTEKQIASIHSSTKKLASDIEEYRDQLESMTQKLELLVTDVNSHSSPSHLSVVGTGVRAEDIEIAFLREKQKRSTS